MIIELVLEISPNDFLWDGWKLHKCQNCSTMIRASHKTSHGLTELRILFGLGRLPVCLLTKKNKSKKKGTY